MMKKSMYTKGRRRRRRRPHRPVSRLRLLLLRTVRGATGVWLWRTTFAAAAEGGGWWCWLGGEGKRTAEGHQPWPGMAWIISTAAMWRQGRG